MSLPFEPNRQNSKQEDATNGCGKPYLWQRNWKRIKSLKKNYAYKLTWQPSKWKEKIDLAFEVVREVLPPCFFYLL